MKLPNESLMTDWFVGHADPARDGLYLVRAFGHGHAFRLYKSGLWWCVDPKDNSPNGTVTFNVAAWRGLTKNGYKEMCK